MLARDCLDWTERKPHLAGGLPAALLARFLELGWLDRRRNDRALTITDLGNANLPALGQLASPRLPHGRGPLTTKIALLGQNDGTGLTGPVSANTGRHGTLTGLAGSSALSMSAIATGSAAISR